MYVMYVHDFCLFVQLQVIFGLLEKSVRRYVDPTDFIHHLGLDAGQQQDAQEFSKLFLSVLEQNLADAPSKRNVIKEQFCGSYAYVTRCNGCKSASERLSDFYELDLNIQGHKSLTEALKGFLQVEKLEGDNKYMCSKCNEKQNATRAIELKVLPPVLNLQLLRFVYDLKTGSKKKLNSIIQFPEVLDMSAHLPNGNAAVYELSAVLIHRGPSAYSGHYVAHIRDRDSQGWYKFNDEEIERIKGKSLQLGNEEDLEAKQKKVTRTPKGFVSSRNAYMLVYTKRMVNDIKHTVGETKHLNNIDQNVDYKPAIDDMYMAHIGQSKSEIFNTLNVPAVIHCSQSVPNLNAKDKMNYVNCTINNVPKTEAISKPSVSKLKDCIPSYIAKFVQRDNDKFEKWVDEMNEMKASNITRGKEKQETVKAIFKDLPYCITDGERFEWIPMSWLTKWLNDPSTTPAIEMTKCLCEHGKISIDKSLKMKCVSQTGSDQLYNLYGGTCRMKGLDSLCMECVKSRCKQIQIKQKIFEDDKFISALMKKNVMEEKFFWIGKGSFRSWRRLALERLLDEVTDFTDGADERNNDKALHYVLEEEKENTEVASQLNTEYETGSHKERKEELPVENINKNGCVLDDSGKELVVSGTETRKEREDGNDVDDNDTLQFNEDLLCEDHRGLEPDISCRRIVPESVWTKLRHYFPDCPEFTMEMPPCGKCLSTIEAEHQDKEMSKKIAATQKTALSNLFYDRKRPLTIGAGSTVFVVSSAFIEAWRTFIRDPVKTECPCMLTNAALLCEHGGFLYPPLEDSLLKSDGKLTYVTEHEWNQLKEIFPVDSEISIMCVSENERKEIFIFPQVCDGCLQNRLNLEEKEIFDYENEIVYIQKNVKNDKSNKRTDAATDSNNDPDFNAGSARKRSISDDPTNSEPPEKLKKVTDAGHIVRKSQRHRRVRGEKEVTVSSNQTLKDLKIQIMKLFSVPPFDQNLYVNGILLSDNGLTLGELKVAPGAVINLIADEAEEDNTTFLDDISKHSGMPESGFKGTNLLSGT